MVYKKAEGRFDEDSRTSCSTTPVTAAIWGTILRTALGFGLKNIAIIRPAVDSDDPRVVRASMGAAFSLNVRHFDSFDQYRAPVSAAPAFPVHADGRRAARRGRAEGGRAVFARLWQRGQRPADAFAQMGVSTLIPHSHQIDSLNLAIAAGIGMYAFTRR